MNTEVLRWLQAQLGPETDPADLSARYGRLHAARAVAEEVLRERIAALLTEPLKVSVNGVATIDNSPNVTALDRHLSQLQAAKAPDDPEAFESNVVTIVQLRARRRR
ncbi:hypothetical protein ACGFRG_05510 [Streptomyces sp. NPDC048696]|uniref:hypothetical protein n=1 Tax=Streptomyces sp. NPDC048696 TaxID=3365585 RepID=UPI00371066C2